MTNPLIFSTAPHPWNITREMWLADDNVNNSRTTESYEPLKLVIIQHTVSAECHFFTDCSAAVRKLQEYFLTNKDLGYDIPLVVFDDTAVVVFRRINFCIESYFDFNKK